MKWFPEEVELIQQMLLRIWMTFSMGIICQVLRESTSHQLGVLSNIKTQRLTINRKFKLTFSEVSILKFTVLLQETLMLLKHRVVNFHMT
jgi:hypothetical protein